MNRRSTRTATSTTSIISTSTRAGKDRSHTVTRTHTAPWSTLTLTTRTSTTGTRIERAGGYRPGVPSGLGEWRSLPSLGDRTHEHQCRRRPVRFALFEIAFDPAHLIRDVSE